MLISRTLLQIYKGEFGSTSLKAAELLRLQQDGVVLEPLEVRKDLALCISPRNRVRGLLRRSVEAAVVGKSQLMLVNIERMRMKKM